WSVEGYWKTMTGIREYNGASMIYPPITSWEKDFVEGRGRSWGAEFSAEYAPGPRTSLTGYYTLSWSQRFFEDFYYDWYNDRCDNRHKITLMVNHKFNDRIDCYAGWNFHSGNSFTIATQAILKQEPYYAQWQHIYEKPNNIKMPAYHRADVGINFRKLRSSGVERVWNLSVYNAYSRINAIMATLGTKYDEKGHIVGWTTNALGVVPIIPTFSYGLNF
ncbi:MAG: TonB-dependent receptor, partial [Bacteroidales bacterium]|nr:TonB-dependent receptor [Bacteroidales bacterium]